MTDKELKRYLDYAIRFLIFLILLFAGFGVIRLLADNLKGV